MGQVANMAGALSGCQRRYRSPGVDRHDAPDEKGSALCRDWLVPQRTYGPAAQSSRANASIQDLAIPAPLYDPWARRCGPTSTSCEGTVRSSPLKTRNGSWADRPPPVQILEIWDRLLNSLFNRPVYPCSQKKKNSNGSSQFLK